MRKLLTFLKAVAISTLIAGCGGTGTETGPEITPEIKFTEDIVTSGISVESAEQSITLSFSTNVAWSATTSADWITISPSSGAAGKNSVKIKVEENTESKQRTATITIKTTDGKCTASIKVTHGKDKIIFEDANFKAYLVANFDTDGDGEISKEKALAITKIIVGTKDIESLAGIEHMANLTELRCEGPWSVFEPEEYPGKLKTLDVSKNVNLTILYCGFNQLTSLDVTNNPKIEQLRCAGNNLNSLDVSKNTELIEFEAYNNRLSSIDVSNNPELYYIDLTNNQIKSIDVSKNLKLGRITCSDNKLTSIDVTNNQKLTELNISGNSIVEIDLGNNPELNYYTVRKTRFPNLNSVITKN